MLYSVTQSATAINVAPSTIRLWTKEFADYLSEHATPDKGITREFTAEDLSVFQTIKTLRDQKWDYDAVHSALRRGERYEPTEQAEPVKLDESTALNDNALTAFEKTLQSYESQVRSLQSKADNLQHRLIDAEKRAAIAEILDQDKKDLKAENESLRAKNESLQAELNQERNKTFWQKLFNK